MNDLVEVTTQAEFDKAVADGNIPVCRNGFFSARGSATVRACDSATVQAWGSATVRAWGSATVRACDSATVRAWGSATVQAWGSATVRAGRFVAVTRHGETAKVNGGVLIQVPPCDEPAEWCDFYDLPVKRGKVVLFKAVDDELRSGRGLAYPIGESVEAQDFTDRAECGGGLHLSPRPFMARRYFSAAPRFLACEVALSDLVVIADSKVSDKVKARRLRVLHEVDVDGEPLVAEAVAA